MAKQKTASTASQEEEKEKGEKETSAPQGSQGSRAVYVVVLLGVMVAVAGVVLRALDLSRENIQLVAREARLQGEQDRLARELEGVGRELGESREALAVREASLAELTATVAEQGKAVGLAREEVNTLDKKLKKALKGASQIVAAAKLEKEGLGEEMRLVREELVQEQSVNSLVREENSEQVKVLEEQEARLAGLEKELGRSREKEAAVTVANTECGDRERGMVKSHEETVGWLNKEMETQAEDFRKQKTENDQQLKLKIQKETEIEQLKGQLLNQKEKVEKEHQNLQDELKEAIANASKEKAELLEAAKVEKDGITNEKQEEVRSILNIVAEKEAEISASKTAVLQKSEEVVVLNASNQELRIALDTFKTQMEAQTKAVEVERLTASKVSEELRAEQEGRQSAEALLASLVEEKSSLEAGVLQAQGDVGECLADRAREVREAKEARDRLQEECAEKARAAQAEEAAGSAARLAAVETDEEQCRLELKEAGGAAAKLVAAESAREQCSKELQEAGGAAAKLAAAESAREKCTEELQEAGGVAAKLAAVESGREQCREELSKVGADLETAKGEVETVKQRLVGCKA